MAETSNQKPALPEFASVEELAEYLDTHDLAEFEDQFEDVEFEFARPLIHVLEVELDAKTIDKMDVLGHEQGLNAHSIARKWLLERLDTEVRTATKRARHAPEQSAG